MLVYLVTALVLQCHHLIQLVNISEFIHTHVVISAYHLQKQDWALAIEC
jgi:hypothetical protein